MESGDANTTPTTAPSGGASDSCSSLTGLQCATLRLWQIVTPIIIVLGLLGNLLVVIIFSRLRFSKSSTLVHLFLLSLTDSLIMCLGPTRYWILNVFGYDVRMVSSAGCKLHLFLLYVSLDFSAWILVSVTVERAVCVLKPLHVRGWFTVRRALCRLLVIVVTLCLVNGHYFFSNGIVAKTDADSSDYNSSLLLGNDSSFFSKNSSMFSSESHSVSKVVRGAVYLEYNATDGDSQRTTYTHVTYDCDSVTPGWETFEEMTFVYIDLCFDSLVPFLIMVTCNTFIIVSLRKSLTRRPRISTRRQLAGLQGSSPHSDPLSDPHSSPPVSEASPSSLTSAAGDRQGTEPSAPPLQNRTPTPTNSSAAPSHNSYTRISNMDNTLLYNDRRPVNNNCTDAEANCSNSEQDTTTDPAILQGLNSSAQDIEVNGGRLFRLPSRRPENILSQECNSNSEHRTTQSRDTSPRSPDPPPEQSTNSPGRSRDSVVSTGVTHMLIVVTTVFLLTTMPSAVYYIVDSYVREDEDESRTNQILDLLQAVTNLLQFSNYGCNFLLYTYRSKRFRLEVKCLLGMVDSRFRRHFQSSVLSGTKRSNRQKCSGNTRYGRTSRTTPACSTTIVSPPPVPPSVPTSPNGHVPRAGSATVTSTETTSGDSRSCAFQPEEEAYNTSKGNGSCACEPEVQSTTRDNHSFACEPEPEVNATTRDNHSFACEPQEGQRNTFVKDNPSFVCEPEADEQRTSGNCVLGLNAKNGGSFNGSQLLPVCSGTEREKTSTYL